MTIVEKIKASIQKRQSDPSTPEEHKIDPARLCRVIEAMVMDLADGEPENEIFSKIFQIAHLASWDCIKNHPRWLDEFLKWEEEIEKEFCSPNDRLAYEKLEAEKLEAEKSSNPSV